MNHPERKEQGGRRWLAAVSLAAAVALVPTALPVRASDSVAAEYAPPRIEAGLEREARERVEALAAAYRMMVERGYDPGAKIVLLWRDGESIRIEFRNAAPRTRDGTARMRFDPATGEIHDVSIDG